MKRALALVPIAVVIAGCGGGSSSSPSASPVALSVPASPSAAPIGTCASAPHGYVADTAHSGALTAHTYSASADVQAALEYDQLASGRRAVYLHHVGAAHSAINGVISCVGLRFSSAHLAQRFYLSYQATRRQAKSVVHEIKPSRSVAGVTGTTAYFEKQQSFRGYKITSTNVVEIAGLADRTLYIASVAGSAPSVPLATKLLTTMAGNS
jgi:hypothetical protein